MIARVALAKAIGALNIVADVEIDLEQDAYAVRFMNGRRVLLDPEIADKLAAIFNLLERELK